MSFIVSWGSWQESTTTASIPISLQKLMNNTFTGHISLPILLFWPLITITPVNPAYKAFKGFHIAQLHTLPHSFCYTVLKILQTTWPGLSSQWLHFPAPAFCSRDFCDPNTEHKGWFCLTVSVLVHDDRKGMVNSWWWQCVLGLLTSWWTRKQRAHAKADWAITFKGSCPVTQL